MIKRVLPLLLFPCLLSAQTTWTVRRTDTSVSGRPAGRPGLYLIPKSGVSSLGLGFYLRSLDGVSWDSITLPRSYPASAAPAVCQFNGRFVGLGDGVLWYSDNGTAAVLVTPPLGGARIASLAYGNSLWVATLEDGRVIRSTTNASSWTIHPTPAISLGAIVFGNGKFLASTSGGSILSTDGITWTIGPPVPSIYDQLCFEAGYFQTDTHTSADGITWAPRSGTNGMPARSYDLRAGGGQVLTWNLDSQPLFFASVGQTWSSGAPSGVLAPIEDAAFCGDMWIAITDGGKVLTSPVPTLPPPTAPPLNITPAIRLTWQSQTGRSYVIQRSTDQTTWNTTTGLMLGTGGQLEWTAPASAVKEFFRVQVQ